jgi:hypothetical protein
MALTPVHFEYLIGLRRQFIVNARLGGSWDATGADAWSFTVMTPFIADRLSRLPGHSAALPGHSAA